MEATRMLELSILGLCTLWIHLRVRAVPMRVRSKLARSIEVYDRLQHQRARLLTSVKPHEHPIMMETLTHLERRISALMYFIQPLRQRYDRFHGDPYARIFLRLPSPPRFDP